MQDHDVMHPTSCMAEAVFQTLGTKGQETESCKGVIMERCTENENSHQLLVFSSLLCLKCLPLGTNPVNWQPLPATPPCSLPSHSAEDQAKTLAE